MKLPTTFSARHTNLAKLVDLFSQCIYPISFLFENSHQKRSCPLCVSYSRYARLDSFDQDSITVLRGRIVTSRGHGLPGVRISSSEQVSAGFTLSRSDGSFDFLVDASMKLEVQLKFGRNPYPFQTRMFKIERGQVRRRRRIAP